MESLLYFANSSDAVLRSPPALEHFIGNSYCSSTFTWIDLIISCYVKNKKKNPLTSRPQFRGNTTIIRDNGVAWILVKMALVNVLKKALSNEIKLTAKKLDCCYPGCFFSASPGCSMLHLTDMALNLFITYILQCQNHWMQYFKGIFFLFFYKGTCNI